MAVVIWGRIAMFARVSEALLYQGSRLSLADTPGLLGAGYFIPVVGVPLLLITQVLVFRLLMRKEVTVSSRVAGRAA